MQKLLRLTPLALAATALFGQAKPQFDVGSVKVSAPGRPDQVSIGIHLDGARISITYLALKDYIQTAYQVKNYQVTGPDWITTEHYDIAATLPAGATQSQVPEMLQTLLAERFQLKLHHETKEFPVYALTVAKSGLKLTESPADPEGTPVAKSSVNVNVAGGRNGVSIDLGRGAYFSFANNKLEGKKLTMTQLCDMLARFMDKPVVDMTGLPGMYDLSLDVTPEDYQAMLIRSAINAGVVLPPQARQMMEAASGDSMLSAIQGAGLKLESKKAPLDFLVVDSASKVPTAN